MGASQANAKTITRLLFRLLPVQILLAAVSSVNGIVSSFFASNYIGVDAMSAVGLYSPINMLLLAVSTMLMGGSAILCGKYAGKNEQKKMQNIFSLNLFLATMIAAVFVIVFALLAALDGTAFLTKDPVVRPLFNRYLLGQAIGVLPLLLGNQLPTYLTMENRGRRTVIASLVYIVVNVILNYLFVKTLHLEAFGLALASSLGLWIFLAVQAQVFTSGNAHLRLVRPVLSIQEGAQILRIGLPGAASYGYQSIRGILVNRLLEAFVGSVGISAFATADNVMRIFWSVPIGMLAVSRLMMSVSIGEEDRQSLTDIMRIMFKRFVPLMYAIAAGIILCAIPFTRVFFRPDMEPVYSMTVWGLRILPLCMPLSIICMHFTCYGQASGKQGLVHVLALLDGVVCVAGFTALLIRGIGMNSVYIANVLNGVVTTLVIVAYAWLQKKHIPKNMEELMVIPESFGVPEDARMDLSVNSLDEVVTVAERVQTFCRKRGIDERRAFLAGLALEEMTGNVVAHGFAKDTKKHEVDVRVVHKDEDVIIRIRDDCVPFDPGERQRMAEQDDITKNIGLRTVFKTAKEVQYQSILGLNVLTMRI